jgi:hypothetical protein
MKKLVVVLLILFATVSNAAPVYTLTVERGYAGPIEFDFNEDVSTYTGNFVVYRIGMEPKTATGDPGTPLFTKALDPGSTTTRLRCVVSASDTAVAGVYFMRGERILGGVIEPWHGTLIISGK